MTDIATLGFRVDSSQLAAGADALERFGDQAQRTGQRTKSAEESASAMAAEFDRLRAKYDPLFAASKRYETQLEELNSAHRLGVLSATQYDAALDRLNASLSGGQGVATSLAQTSRAMRLLGVNAQQAQQGMRMLPFQLNQMAQMGAVTGNWMQAISIQLPDILQGFGTMRLVMLGTGAALATSLIPALIQSSGLFGNVGREAETLSDRLEELERIVATTRDITEQLSMSNIELAETYGDAAEAVRRNLIEQLQLMRIEARSQMTETLDEFQALGDSFAQVTLEQDLFGNIVENIDSGLANIREAFGVTESEARILFRSFESLQDATGFQDQLDAVENLRRVILEIDPSHIPAELRAALLTSVELQNTSVELANALDRAQDAAGRLGRTDMAAGIGAALDVARGLSQQLGISYATALRIANMGGRGVSGPDAAIASIRESGTGLGAPLTDVVSTWRSPRSSGGGGGGGGSGAREITAEVRAADQAIRQAQEAAVQFADVQAVLNQRLADGSITLDTYNAAIEQARDRYTQVGEAAQFWQQQQETLKNGILDAIVAGESLADTFRNLAQAIARAALEAALFGTGPFAGPNSGSGLLGGLFGGFREQGGPVSPGRAYVVGEKRPELFVPNTAGRIVPQVGGNGVNVTVSVDARGAEMGAADRITRQVRAMIPEITAAVQGKSVSDRSRGRVA